MCRQSHRPVRRSALSAQSQCTYYEFEEVGMNKQLGYASPADPIRSRAAWQADELTNTENQKLR
jgi:hypothetical protein